MRRRLDMIRLEAESVSRDLPTFLREPGRPEQSGVSDIKNSKTLDVPMPRLEPVNRWENLDVAKILVAGMFLGMVVTLMAQGILR